MDNSLFNFNVKFYNTENGVMIMQWVKQNEDGCICFICSFLALLTIDLLFQIISGFGIDVLVLMRIYLFDTALALLIVLISSFFKPKTGKLFIGIILLIYAIYGIGQLGFEHFMGNYMSFKIALDSAKRVTGNAVEFILAIRLTTYSLFIPVIIAIVILFKHQKPMIYSWKKRFVLLILLIIAHGLSLLTMQLSTANQGLYGALELYHEPEPVQMAIEVLGINRFMTRDILSTLIEKDEVVEIVIEEPVSSDDEAIIDETEEDYSRKIDDSRWLSLIEKEENNSIKTIDEYLINRTISDKNEMTGLFAGKNLIYIMVEAFDYMAIDEALTPTLYFMQQQGISFDHYYTPKYSCTTSESEFISLVSLVPQSGLCTPNSYKDNLFTQSIFELFNRKGYTSTSYHNWNDQFYERKTYHINMGSKYFYDVDDLNIKIIQGWQSDAEMVENALPYFSDDEPFFAFMITSSTHFPYDTSSTLGDRYLSEVSAVYPDMPINLQRYLSKAMELDKAMESLLSSLEEKGILEDTVIVMYADHHPLKTDTSLIVEWTKQIDRSVGLNIDRTPCFIYNSVTEPMSVDTLASTYDLVPTIANLFDLDYDPRFYVGRDIFSDQQGLVIFNNGDWIVDEGIYTASNNKFESFDGTSYSNEWIENINARVNNLFSISKSIYKTNYFKVRDFDIIIKK